MPGTRRAPDRSRQRARTKQALVEAAAAMLRAGGLPTVAEAAAAAGVHRATAYRYFPTPELLLSEAALTASAPSVAELVAGVPADDPFALLDAVVSGFAAFAFADEALVRTNVRNGIDRWFTGSRGPASVDPTRESRRFDYLEPVVAAVAGRLPADRLGALRNGLTLVFGAEAVVVARDVCGLEPAEATEMMRSAAAALLRGALDEPGGGRPLGDGGATG